MIQSDRSALLKDRRLLKGFQDTTGDRPLDETTAFHVERWKTLRATEAWNASHITCSGHGRLGGGAAGISLRVVQDMQGLRRVRYEGASLMPAR